MPGHITIQLVFLLRYFVTWSSSFIRVCVILVHYVDWWVFQNVAWTFLPKAIPQCYTIFFSRSSIAKLTYSCFPQLFFPHLGCTLSLLPLWSDCHTVHEVSIIIKGGHSVLKKGRQSWSRSLSVKDRRSRSWSFLKERFLNPFTQCKRTSWLQ